MSLEQAYYISQLISTLALLASVIYLGRQTHLVAKGQLAQMHQARSEQYQDVMLHMVEGEFQEFATRAVHGDLSLSDEHVRRFYFYGVTVLRIFEETFRQWREGIIAPDRWASSRKTLEGLLRSPGYRGCFEILRGNLDGEFVSLLEDMIAGQTATGPIDLPTAWRAAVTKTRGAVETGET